jgi:hypothetical protein
MILLNKENVITMTSKERVEGLHQALKDVHLNSIEGDFVECGIYMGGNIIIAKKFFDSVNDLRNFYCYDTFKGMTEPGEFDGSKAHKIWQTDAKCEASLDKVIEQFYFHKIFDNRIKIVEGDVRKTLKKEIDLPKKISILRLDTDFYDSTLIELQSLYHRIVLGGYLIIDDYGHWSGCKKATNEFFGEEFVLNNFKKLDYTGIMLKKICY